MSPQGRRYGKLISVHSATNRMEAGIVAGLLESAGIKTFVSADDAGGIRPELAFTRGVDVFVPADEADQARRVIEEAELEAAFERDDD